MDFKLIFEGCIKGLKTRHGESFFKGNRNNFVYRLACACNRYGIPKDVCIRLASIRFQETTYTITEIRASINNAYSKNLNEHSKYIWNYGKTKK